MTVAFLAWSCAGAVSYASAATVAPASLVRTAAPGRPVGARQTIARCYVQDAATGAIAAYDASNGRPAGTIPDPFGAASLRYGGGSGLAFDATGNLIAAFTVSGTRTIGVTALFSYGVLPGSTKPTLLRKTPDPRVGAIAAGPAGEVANAVTALDGGIAGVELLDAETAAHGRFVSAPGPIGSLAFDPGGTLVISGTADGTPYLGTIAPGGRTVRPLTLAGAAPLLGPLTIDRAGRLGVFTGDGVTLYAANGTALGHVSLSPLADATATVVQLAISQDERRVYLLESARGGSYVAGYDLRAGGAPAVVIAVPNAALAALALDF